MPPKLTAQDVQARLPEWITIDDSTYSSPTKRSRFVDSEYGEFWCKPSNILHYGSPGHKKRWHPNRGKTKRLNQQEIADKLPPELVLDFSTYRSIHQKARFIDSEYGEFWTRPSCILYMGSGHPARSRQKTIDTNIQRYGTPNPMQCETVYKKCARAQTKSVTLYHWETGDKLTCTGSMEIYVVNWLNENRIKFQWQIPFLLPNKKKYFCDLFLVDSNKYVEIKGYFRKDAQEKWQMFQKIHPNCELWTRDFLKTIGYKIPSKQKRCPK